VRPPISSVAGRQAASLSFRRDDDDAVRNWRKNARHREGQTKGRGGIFADYRPPIAATLHDYGINERAEAPADSLAAHDRHR